MKYLLALFFIGLASASFIDVLDDASNDVVMDFMVGMENAPSLSETMGYGYSGALDQVEDDIKTALGKSLREALDNVLAKIHEAVDHGKVVSEELIKKAEEVAARLKEIGVNVGNKTKDLIERIRENTKAWIRNLLEKLGLSKRSLTDLVKDLISQLDFKSIFGKLKEKLLEKVDLDTLIIYITRVFAHEDGIKAALIEIAKEKGIEALKKLIVKLIPGGDGSYSIADVWQNIKDYFKGLGVQIKEHFGKFAEWLKVTVKEGINKAKDKATNLKNIAKEVLEHSKTMSKEAAREALEFFRPYKEDLGTLWDELKEAVRKVVVKSDDF